MTEQQAIQLFKCLADKSRIQILKSLLQEEMYVERLAERIGVTPATVSFHLKKLEDVGAVKSRKDQYYSMFSINNEIFNISILDILKEESEDDKLQKERELQYRKKERIVLEEIAKSFEAEREYTEREINIMIADFHDDFCTIRRDMISEGILQRENMIYKKI